MDTLAIKANAYVTITKLDEHDNVIDIIEQEVPLTKEEADALWHSLQKA